MNRKLKKDIFKKHDRGFSLIEIMVSVAVFSVVMLIGIGSLLSIIDANKKARSFQLVMNNLNFAMEDMVRNIRIGTTYHCGFGNVAHPQNCNSGDDLIAVELTGGNPDTSSDQVVYRFNNSQIEKSTKGGASNSFVAITAPEIIIESLEFYVSGALQSDKKQPRVLIMVSGYTNQSEKIKSDFKLQTMVSQRILDF